MQEALKHAYTLKSEVDGLNVSEGIQVQKDHTVYYVGGLSMEKPLNGMSLDVLVSC